MAKLNRNKKTIVVTGMGAITPIGNNINDFWHNLLKGESGIDFNTKFDTQHFRCKISGQIKNFDLNKHFNQEIINEIKDADLSIQYGLCSCEEAIRDSFIGFNHLKEEEIGLFIGQTVGGSDSAEKHMKDMIVTKKLIDSGNLYYTTSLSSVPYWFSKVFHINAFTNMVSTGCAASTDAIGSCFHLMQQGFFDVGICGGIEAPIAPGTIASFDVIKGLSSRDTYPKAASAPFSAERDGFVPSEGAGFLVLEELEHALKRNAKIYGAILGYGNNANAHHMSAPLPSGLVQGKVMAEALVDANLDPSMIDYINAHGSSTPLNDGAETKAIKYAFGQHSKQISISSTKSVMGHTLGAAGALELIISILTVHYGKVPPTINLNKPDVECDLDYTPNVAVNRDIKNAMSNSAGFSGVNCSIVVGKKTDNTYVS